MLPLNLRWCLLNLHYLQSFAIDLQQNVTTYTYFHCLLLNDLDLPIIAIAKGKNRNAGVETIYHENKEFKFEKNDPLLFFIQRLRDEAHRFAISTHRAKRKKSLSKSLLDQIDGIGKQRKKSLLNHFGSARAVESASFEELKSVEGIEDNVAKKIYDYFHE